LLCGSAELVSEARRGRKMLGGGMRQAGILAAAGLVALDRHVDRLAEDHDNAQRLAEGLAGIEELDVEPTLVQTNMVFASVRAGDAAGLSNALREQGIRIPAVSPMRLVTHLDVARQDVEQVVEAARRYFSAGVRRAG
jgi:threonine aldolase